MLRVSDNRVLGNRAGNISGYPKFRFLCDPTVLHSGTSAPDLTSDRPSRCPDFQKSRSPEVQKSRSPEVQKSRSPEVQKSRSPENWNTLRLGVNSTSDNIAAQSEDIGSPTRKSRILSKHQKPQNPAPIPINFKTDASPFCLGAQSVFWLFNPSSRLFSGRFLV